MKNDNLHVHSKIVLNVLLIHASTKHIVYQGNGGSPVHQAERVDLDEAGTVNEHLGTHVTQGD